MVHQPFCFFHLMEKKRLRPRVRAIAQTFLHDGLLDSFQTFDEFAEFGDESNHFRDYSLQTLIKAEAIELLKPVGTLPYDALRSADVLTSAVGSFDNLAHIAKQTIDNLKFAEDSATKNVENNG